MTLLSLFGAVALALAAIGIYGVLSFAVTRRSRELAIRQALGARRSTIIALVLNSGMRTAAAGVMLVITVATVATRALQAFLFEVGPYDIAVFAAVSVLLLSISACASYIPARRATNVEPVVALRDM